MLSSEKITSIVAIVNHKKELFKEFLELSKLMLNKDVDELVSIDEKRSTILEQLKGLDKEVFAIYENESDADYISRILKNQENRGELPQEYLEIFDTSQEMLGFVYHVNETETQVKAHLELCKKKLMKQIESNQKSGKIVGYLNALDQQHVPEGSRLSSGSRNA